MEYRIIKGPRGIRYMKGTKFCSKSDVPDEVLAKLTQEDRVDTSRDCPFCGELGTEEKTLNSVRYHLCLDDYNSKTTGELAATIALNKA